MTTKKVTRVRLPVGYQDVLFDRDLKSFILLIKGKKWIKHNDKIINVNHIVYAEEIDY